MGIKKDSGELLEFIYLEYTTKDSCHITPQDIIDLVEWDSMRINNAIKQLMELDVINIITRRGLTPMVKTIEGVEDFIITGVKPNGIDIIEDGKKFWDTFGIELNFTFIKASFSRKRN